MPWTCTHTTPRIWLDDDDDDDAGFFVRLPFEELRIRTQYSIRFGTKKCVIKPDPTIVQHPFWDKKMFSAHFFDKGTSYQTKMMMMMMMMMIMMMMMMQASLFGFHFNNYGSEHSIASVLGPKNV